MAPKLEALPDPAVPDDEVLDALAALSRALVGLTTRSLGQLDVEVTLPQLRTLVVLASRGPQRIGDLAAALGVQASTVSRGCDRLVRRRLVRRVQCAGGDRRVVRIALTDAGKELVGQVMHQRRAELARLMSYVVLEGSFAAVLTALAAASGELPDPVWWERWAGCTHLEPGPLT